MAKLREMKIDDAFSTNGRLRADGVMAHDMYLTRVKSPAQSTGLGDNSVILKTLSGDQANIPLAQSECPLVKK